MLSGWQRMCGNVLILFVRAMFDETLVSWASVGVEEAVHRYVVIELKNHSIFELSAMLAEQVWKISCCRTLK